MSRLGRVDVRGHVVLRIVLIASLLLLPPTVAALAPVSGCTQQCTAKADDVNGPEAKTGAASVKEVFYFHYQSLVDIPPINLQPPAPDSPEVNEGFLLPTVAVGGTGTPADEALNMVFNKFAGYSTPGFVEWHDGERRIHGEPGFAEDVVIVGDSIPMYFYLSAYPVPGQSSTSIGPAPAAMPQVGVRATMNAGRNPGHGDVIASGDTGAQDLVKGVAGGPGRVDLVTLPGGEEVYELRIDMAVQNRQLASSIHEGKGFTVTVIPYQVAPQDAAKGTQATQGEWRARISARTPPHLVMEIATPLLTKSAKLSLFNQAMFVRWSLVSPLGSYDLDEPTMQVRLTGPTTVDPGNVGLSRPLVIRRSVDHDAHFKPSNVTWKFDYRRAGLADGTYTMHLAALNLQDTYRLEETLAFTVKGGQPTDVERIGAARPLSGPDDGPRGAAPGPDGLGLLAVVLVALGVARRRA